MQNGDKENGNIWKMFSIFAAPKGTKLNHGSSGFEELPRAPLRDGIAK